MSSEIETQNNGNNDNGAQDSRRTGMIHRIVQMSLRQRFLVIMLVAFMSFWGVLSFQRMPVDAYPDLSPPHGRDHHAMAGPRRRGGRAPGHAFPLEVEMNGIPQLEVMRSISLYGLSDVILTFEDGADDYFAREVVFQRLGDATSSLGRDADSRTSCQSQRAGLPLRD